MPTTMTSGGLRESGIVAPSPVCGRSTIAGIAEPEREAHHTGWPEIR
jgi:hypothetical protein